MANAKSFWIPSTLKAHSVLPEHVGPALVCKTVKPVRGATPLGGDWVRVPAKDLPDCLRRFAATL